MSRLANDGARYNLIMLKLSAGILVYRKSKKDDGPVRDANSLRVLATSNGIEIFLVHPGGPFFAGRDKGVWSIPKGEYMDGEGGPAHRSLSEGGEEALAAAKREFKEETGFEVPEGKPTPLLPIKQAGGKIVSAWVVEGDMDASKIKSNTFKIFGKEFPEVDRAEWFTLSEARVKINPAQVGFLEELEKVV